MDLGNLRWLFSVVYKDSGAAKQAKKDLEDLKKATEAAKKEELEHRKALDAQAAASDKAAQKAANLVVAKKGLSDASKELQKALLAEKDALERLGRAQDIASKFTAGREGANARSALTLGHKQVAEASAASNAAIQNLSNAQLGSARAAIANTAAQKALAASLAGGSSGGGGSGGGGGGGSSVAAAALTASEAFGTLAGAIVGINLYKFIRDTTLLAGRVENLQTVTATIGSLAGRSVANMALLERQIISLGITTRVARESLALLAQSEIDLSKAGVLARIAQDAAVIAGINSSEAFERLTVSIQRTNTWMLRSLGILINLTNVYRDFAIANGRVITTLSTGEKQQILMNEVIRKGAVFAGVYEAALGDVYKRFTTLDRVIEESKRLFGEQFLPVFTDVVDSTNSLLTAWQKADPTFKAATASVATFTTVIVGLTVATNGAIFAAKAIAMTLSTGPWGALVLAVSGLAAAYIYLTAQERNLEQQRKKEILDNEVYIEKLVELRDVITKLAIAEAIRNKKGFLTAAELQQVNDATANAIKLLPEHASDIRVLAGSYGELITKMKGWTPDLWTDSKDFESNLKRDLEVAKKARDEIVKRESGVGEFGETGNQDKIDKANQQVDILEARYKQLEVKRAESSARELEQMTKDLETGVNLAQRYANLRQQSFGDELTKEANDFENHMTELGALMFKSNLTIEKFNAGLMAERKVYFERLDDEEAAAIFKGTKSVEDAAQDKAGRIKIRLDQDRLAMDAITQDLAYMKEQYDGIISTFDAQVRARDREIEAVNAQFEAVKYGMDASIVESIQKVTESKAKAATALEEINTQIKQVTDNRKKILDQGTLFGPDKIQQESVLKQNEIILEKLLEKRNQLHRKYDAELALLLTEMTNKYKHSYEEIVKATEDAERKRADLLGTSFTKSITDVQRLIDKYKSSFESVEKFIRDLNAEVNGEQIPGLKKLTEEFDKFGAAVDKAVNPDQLDKIAKLFPKALQQDANEAAKAITNMQKKAADLQQKIFVNQMKARQEFRDNVAKGMDPGQAAIKARDELALENQKNVIDLNELEQEANKIRGNGNLLNKEQARLIGELNKKIAERRAAIAKEPKIDDLIKKEADLKKAELEHLNEEILKNEKILEIMQKQYETRRKSILADGGPAADALLKNEADEAARKQKAAAQAQQQMDNQKKQMAPPPPAGMAAPPVIIDPILTPREQRRKDFLDRKNRNREGFDNRRKAARDEFGPPMPDGPEEPKQPFNREEHDVDRKLFGFRMDEARERARKAAARKRAKQLINFGLFGPGGPKKKEMPQLDPNQVWIKGLKDPFDGVGAGMQDAAIQGNKLEGAMHGQGQEVLGAMSDLSNSLNAVIDATLQTTDKVKDTRGDIQRQSNRFQRAYSSRNLV